MVNFFIGRPIFATVLALLMLLIGGICAFLLPIAQYPQIAPPQVQVTTTYTGADALSVAQTVTTPIEQQINGTKGMIYFSSDSTSNGVSNIVATFDVGYSQDIGGRRHPEQGPDGPAAAPARGQAVRRHDQEDVDRHGLRRQPDLARRPLRRELTWTTTARSTSPTSLKRITGRQRRQRLRPQVRHADLARPGPPGRACRSRRPRSSRRSSRRTSRPPPARSAASPSPTGQAFEFPITVKGRLEKASEFEEIIVRRNDDGSIVRLRDVADVELSSENFETAGYLDGKPAGAIPVYQYADANALAIVDQVRREMDRLKKASREGLDYTIAYNTTEYVEREHRARSSTR